MKILGRGKIRKDVPTLAGASPLQPTTSRENRRIKLWDIEPKPGTTAARLTKHYLAALNAVDAVVDHKSSSARSGKFTQSGLGDEVMTFARSHVAALKRGRVALDHAKREAAEKRSTIKIQAPDPNNLVAAMLRAEMRDFIRSKPAKERDEFISRNLERMNPEMALALLEVPPEMTRVAESHLTLLRDLALEAQHGDTMRELQELEAAIQITETAVETGRDEIRAEIGVVQKGVDGLNRPITGVLSTSEFNANFAAAERAAGVAWLRKDGDKVITVDLERNIGRQPTPEELETGIFFANYEEYAKANGITERSAA